MASVGTAAVLALFLAVALVAALSGFIAANVARRNKRRSLMIFVVGVFCWQASSSATWSPTSPTSHTS